MAALPFRTVAPIATRDAAQTQPIKMERHLFGTNALFGEDHLERDEKQGYPKDLFYHWVGQAGRKLGT